MLGSIKLKCRLLKIVRLTAALLMVWPVLCFAEVAKTKATAKQAGFGLGIIVGAPTGPSFKKWLDQQDALASGVAWSFDDDTFDLHVDYVRHKHRIVESKDLPGLFSLYYGGGVRIKEDRDFHVGVRVPIGVTYLAKSVPVETFFELVPILDLSPSTDLELDAGLGVRYWFK